MKIDTKDILYILTITGLIIVILMKSCGTPNDVTLANNLQDSIVKTINKLNQEESRTFVLETQRVSDFIKIKSSDSVLLILQGKVKYYKDQLKNGGNVTVIGNTTSINTSGETIISYDTIYLHQSQIEVFPVYEMTLNNQWYKGKIIANKDSTNLKIEIENEYTIAIGEEGKWWKKKIPFVEVTNNNPYTKTKTLKTYQISKPKDKKFGLGIMFGYGVGSNGLSPTISVGINYNIIKF